MFNPLKLFSHKRTATAVQPSRVTRERHQSDEKAMRAEGYSIISKDSLLTQNGKLYIRKDVQQRLIDQAVSDTRASLIRELALPVTPGTLLRSIHEIKVSK